MNSIHRQMWQRCAMLLFGISLIGCGSSKTNNSTQSVAATNTTTTAPATAPNPAMANPAAMHMGAANPNAAGSTASGSATPTSPMAAMHGQQGANANNAQAAANMNTTSDPMKQHQMMANSAQPTANANAAAAKPMPMPSHDQMMAMNKNNAAAANGAAAPSATPDMSKMHQGAAPQQNANANANPNAKGAHGAMAAGGANAGQPAGTTRPGAGGGAQGSKFAPGSADEAIYNFCVAMAEGDTNAASEYVSPKAKGLLGELRDGNLSEEKIEEIQNLISPIADLKPNQDSTSSTKRSLRNGKDQSMSFTLKKEKDVYRITEFSFPKTKKKS